MPGEQTIAFNRFGLGARPGERIGSDPRGWVLDQIGRFEARPAALAGQPSRSELVTMFRTYRDEAEKQRKRKRRTDEPAGESMALQESENRPADGTRINTLRDAYLSASSARLAAALQSDTPFAERLVHFWSNHFAVSADKQPVVPLAGNYEFEAIRPYIMGSFLDLLTAAVLHPAMLLFLDQAQSIGPNSALAGRAARRRNGEAPKLGLNENLAREILELHTLGVRTGYTQQDVTELARALTGWVVAGLGRERLARLIEGKPGQTLFVAALHEPGARSILGRRYSDSGIAQVAMILRDLAQSPATARHLATKLARHFSADDPPPALIARLEHAYLDSNGDLPTLYRALAASNEAWDPARAKFRNPWDWTVAALRASGTRQLPGRRGIAAVMQQLGQPVWRPGSPAGFGDTTADWAGPGALINRVEVAQQIASRVGNALDPRALARQVLPDGLSSETAQAVARADQPTTGLALLLASPEFLRR